MMKVPKVGRYLLLDSSYDGYYWAKVMKITNMDKNYITVTAIKFTGDGSCPSTFKYNKTLLIELPIPSYYTIHKNMESVLAKEL